MVLSFAKILEINTSEIQEPHNRKIREQSSQLYHKVKSYMPQSNYPFIAFASVI